MEINELKDKIQEVLDSKKAIDIEVISVGEKTTLADYFIVASGTSTTHVKSLAEEVEYQVKTSFGVFPDHIEGAGSSRWILIDYKDVVVHIFHPQERTEYNLEKLWTMKRPEVPEQEE